MDKGEPARALDSPQEPGQKQRLLAHRLLLRREFSVTLRATQLMENAVLSQPAIADRRAKQKPAQGFGGWCPQVVMFDLDGTLIDTMGGFADLAAGLVHEHYGLEVKLARKRYLETSGVPFRQQLEIIFSGDPRNDTVAATYEARKPGICAHARMNEDTLWTLELLRSWGIRLVVSSNGAQHFVDDFQKTSPFSFDLVLGHGPGMAKGQPHVDRVMELFSITPDQMLFVGDSLKDGELARGCGQRFIGRTGTFRREEFEARLCGVPAIDQLSDLRFMVAPCK